MSRAEPPSGGGSDSFESALPAELAMARLPAGRHGLPRSFVAQNQRLRIVAATLRVLPEHGYPALRIGDITREAAVSRAAFYEHFAGKEECFLATYDVVSGWFCGRIESAVAAEAAWRDRIRSGSVEALRLLGANPLVAHLIAVEAPQAGRTARKRQQQLLARFAAAVRADHPGDTELADDLADMLLGGVLSLVARYAEGERAEDLPEATRTLVEYLLLPYIGAEETSAAVAALPATGGPG